MKKGFLLIALVLLVCLLPLTAFADGESELIEMLASRLPAGNITDFETGEAAWGMIYDLLSTEAEETGNYEFTAARVESAYDELFAFGELLPMPAQFEGLTKNDDGYTLEPMNAVDKPYVHINSREIYDTDNITLDTTVLTQSPIDDGTEKTQLKFQRNLEIGLLPDEDAPFGARIEWFSETVNPVPLGDADALSELPRSGSLTYNAANMIDGKPDTCWAYQQAENPGATATLFTDNEEEFSVRGISFTPGYAKSDSLFVANNRVKSLEVTLSDGSKFSIEVDEYEKADAWTTLLFDGEYTATWIRIQVTDVYPGSKYDDTCISEVIVF